MCHKVLTGLANSDNVCSNMTQKLTTNTLVPEPKQGSREAPALELPKVGEWFWVAEEDEDEDGEEGRKPWLGCVVHQGSNYVELHGPAGRNSIHTTRIHVDGIDKWLKRELDPNNIITRKVDEQRGIIAGLTDELRQLMCKLALGLRAADSETRAIAVSIGGSAEDYKKALIKAKDKTAPEILKKISEASEMMACWMQAPMIPLKADTSALQDQIDLIKKRIFGVELYAGLIEQVTVVQEGAPAAANEPLWLFQRRHYMDEECLIDYDAGGMTFEKLEDFDKWLLRPRNLARILPHPRCLVAFQVRRKEKEERYCRRDLSLQDFIKMVFGYGHKADELTYLYMRNGDQIYRLETGIEFGERLFPDAAHSVLVTGKIYAIKDFSNIERLATEGEYLDTKRREAEEEREIKKLSKEDRWHFNSKIRYPTSKWILWDHSTVYYDDITAYVGGQLEAHNRLVLVLQGLLDRSEVFHPHPAYKLWVQADFMRAIKLVYDDSRALVAGDAPNFAAYQSTLNSSLHKGSNTVGQDDFWQRVEAKRQNERESRNAWRRHGESRVDWIRYEPEGNPGPGLFAVVQEFSFARGCTYTWQRKRMRRRRYWSDEKGITGCRLVVPTNELLNLDAYTKGDYHKFYDDPRTRADYLPWAQLLLPAEEWCANKGKK